MYGKDLRCRERDRQTTCLQVNGCSACSYQHVLPLSTDFRWAVWAFSFFNCFDGLSLKPPGLRSGLRTDRFEPRTRLRQAFWCTRANHVLFCYYTSTTSSTGEVRPGEIVDPSINWIGLALGENVWGTWPIFIRLFIIYGPDLEITENDINSIFIGLFAFAFSSVWAGAL